MKPGQDRNLRDRIATALEAAGEDADRTRLSTLRLVTAALRDRESVRRGADEGPAPIGDAEVAEILATMLRQREAAISGYEEAGQLDLAEEERREMAVLREFLPRPLSADEVATAVLDAIAATEARSLADLGAVMKALKARHAGRMDFCKVGADVRARLR